MSENVIETKAPEIEETTNEIYTESTESPAEISANPVESSAEPAAPAAEELFESAAQPEPKKPRASHKKKESEPVAEEAPVAETESAPAPAPRRRRPARTIKSLTGSLEAQTEESKSNAAWSKILNSMRYKDILKGVVSGIEVWNKMPCAVLVYQGIKVLIPATKFLLSLPAGEDTDERSATYLRKTYSYIENRLGSEVEFIIAGFVSKSDQIVAASRCDAMRKRQREYFMRKTRDGSAYLLNEGSRVEVRVASAMRFGLVVEIGGIDVLVPNNEVSWARKSDISGDFYTGQKLIAVITKLDREDEENIEVEVSIKRAKTDPFDKAVKLLTTDRSSKYLGQVTMVDRTGVYVQLEDEIEVVCRQPRDGKNVVVGSRVAVRVFDINEERRNVRGEIVWNGGVHAV